METLPLGGGGRGGAVEEVQRCCLTQTGAMLAHYWHWGGGGSTGAKMRHEIHRNVRIHRDTVTSVGCYINNLDIRRRIKAQKAGG